MHQADFGYTGRLDVIEAQNVLSLLGGACSLGSVARAGATVPATDSARACAVQLMEMRGLRRGHHGSDRFPVAVRATELHDAAVLSVELHPFMREPAALPALVGHLVGGVPGRLVQRLWGRWNQVVEEPTEQLTEAVGAGHVRFAQFREEVLVSGLARARAVCGMAVETGTERNGRGAKVVRVRFSVGPAPSWLAGGQTVQVASLQARKAVAAAGRAELYRLVLGGMRRGTPLGQTLASVRDWLLCSAHGADLQTGGLAAECAAAGSLLPAATALEAVLLQASSAVHGLGLLCVRPWPDGAVGQSASKAFALRAAGCMARSGQPPESALQNLIQATETDEQSGNAQAADAAVLRAVFSSLLEIVASPLPQSGAGWGVLDARERFLLASSADGPDAAETLFALADAAERAA